MDKRDAASGPTYGRDNASGRVYAVFGKDSGLLISPSRARCYPGLGTEAPPTRALYIAASEWLEPRSRVLDAGCGCGDGARVLLDAGFDVTAVDSDPHAASFSSQWALGARVVEATVEAHPCYEPYDGAVVIDVLGHADDPFSIIRATRDHTKREGRVFVSEPRSYPGQVLRAPQRRAFTRRSLGAMLTMAGLRVERVIGSTGGFLAAEATVSEECQPLLDAVDAQLRGDLQGALSAFEAALASPLAEVRMEALLGMADLYVGAGSGDAACEAFFEAQKHAPDDARPLAGLAQVMLIAGEGEQAVRFATEAVSADPCEPAAAVAFASVQPEGSEEAVFAWRVAHNLLPDRLDVATQLAEAAGRLERHTLGLFALEHVRGYGEQEGSVALHLAMTRALARAGRKKDAKLELDVAQRLAPTDIEVARLRRELAVP